MCHVCVSRVLCVTCVSRVCVTSDVVCLSQVSAEEMRRAFEAGEGYPVNDSNVANQSSSSHNNNNNDNNNNFNNNNDQQVVAILSSPEVGPVFL